MNPNFPRSGTTVWTALVATVLAVLSCLALKAQVNESNLPKIEQVGAANMPKEIAALSVPFSMPSFARPQFPERRVVLEKPDGSALMTRQIQAAIDDTSSKGGGTVVLSKGLWNTGRLVLKSHVNLHVDEGAELHFSGEVADYQPAVFTRSEGVEVTSLGALIYANGQENIAITGKGKLVGPPLECGLRRQKNKVSVDKMDARMPVTERHYDGRDGGPVFLPVFIGPVNCKGVFIEGLSLEQTAFWNIVPLYCDGVVIRGVTINSVGIACGDGIDVDSSRNVLIEYCTFSCGDDCIAIKSGRGEDALRVAKASENIAIRRCLVLKGHAGVSTGSETGGMVRKLWVGDCVFLEPVVGIRFKTRRPRAGGGEQLFYERIRIGNCSTAIAWDMLGEAKFVGQDASRLPAREVNALTPVYRNISISQVLVDKALVCLKVFGIPESPARDIHIDGLQARTERSPIIMNDVEGLVLRHAQITSATAELSFLDARKIRFEQCRFEVPGGKVKLTITGPRSGEIHFDPEIPRE